MGIHHTWKQMRGLLVISLEDGKRLGQVRTLYLDGKALRLAGVGVGDALGKERFLGAHAVDTVGTDVVLVRSEATTVVPPDVRTVRGLEGRTVTTLDGRRLGRLTGVSFKKGSWEVDALVLKGGASVRILERPVIVGPDELLVPADSVVTRTTQVKRAGLLDRLAALKVGSPKAEGEAAAPVGVHPFPG